MNDKPKTHLPLLTTSAIKVWKSCHRRYKFAYVENYRAIERPFALRFGTLFHKALEAWWRARSNRLDAAFAALDAGESDPFDRARARATMRGYHVRWESSPLVGHEVEAEFVTDLINPETGAPSKTWRLGGKLDVLARDAHGLLWLIEHKTTTQDISPGSPYWRHLRLDAQVSNYFTGARSLGIELAGCIYDVIKRPIHHPKTATPIEEREFTQAKPERKHSACRGKGCDACVGGMSPAEPSRLYAKHREFDETPDEFEARICLAIADKPDEIYMRGEVVRLEEEEREAAADAWGAGREIREAELANRYPRNDMACEQYGRACEFLEVCERSALLTDVTKYRRAERAHEELSASTSQAAAE